MKCHCTEIEELRAENDTLRDLLQGVSYDRTRAWDQLDKIEALIEKEEARMASGPVLFDGSHFPAVVTVGELREVLNA